MLRSTGVGVFRSPFHFLYCQTYRGGLSIYRKFRVKISTRSAYLFGASIIRGASGRHIGNFRRTFIFHCVALLSVYSLPGICSGGSFSNRPVGFVFRNRGTYQQRTRHCFHFFWYVERLRFSVFFPAGLGFPL